MGSLRVEAYLFTVIFCFFSFVSVVIVRVSLVFVWGDEGNIRRVVLARFVDDR